MRNWFSPDMKRSWTTAVQKGIFMLAQRWCRAIARRETWEIKQPAFLTNRFNLTRICSEWIRRVIKQIESMVKANTKPLLNTMIIQTFTIIAFVKIYPRAFKCYQQFLYIPVNLLETTLAIPQSRQMQVSPPLRTGVAHRQCYRMISQTTLRSTAPALSCSSNM